jgi:hypothetical protein
MKLARGALAITTVAASLLAIGVPACGSTDEVVARIPCKQTTDCGPDSFCSKTTCGAPTGTCELRTSCSNPRGFVCGCSGLLYWDDCLRQQHGDSADQTVFADGGTCPVSAVCSTTDDCLPKDPDAHCVHPLGCPAAGDRGPTGICLVLPAECPSSMGPYGLGAAKFSACTCAEPHTSVDDYCAAVHAETPVYISPRQTCP